MSRVTTPRRSSSTPTTPEIKIPGPTELNVPPDQLLEYTICIYGTKGIGKTTLVSSIPNSLTIMTEPLRKNLPIRQIALRCLEYDDILATGIDAWAQFKSILDRTKEDDSIEVYNIDTVDRMYEACLNHHCVKERVRHPGGLNDFGKLWAVIKDDFETTMNRIRDWGKGLVLISHTKETDVEVVTGGKVTQYGPSCQNASLKYIKAACDYAMFYGYSADHRRLIHLRGYDSIWTACGVPDRFISPSGSPLTAVEIPEGETQGWSRIQNAFENKVYDIDEEPPTDEVKKPSRRRA